MAQHVLGIVLDTASLTAVRLSGTTRSYDVTLREHHVFPEHPEPDEQAELQRQAIQDILTALYQRGDSVVVALPTHQAVLRNLQLPFKDPRRLRQALKFALDEHMPFEPEDVVADYYRISPAASMPVHLLAAAVPQEVVESTLERLDSAHMEPAIIDLDVFGLANAALLGGMPLPIRTVLMDVQPARTLFTLLVDNVPVFARSVLQGTGGDDPHGLPEATILSKQLQHTIYACEHTRQQPYVPEAIMLSGPGGEQLGRLALGLQEAFGVSTQLWRLTASAFKPGSAQPPFTDQGRYAVAIGTALRGFYRQAVGINLRREQFALHGDLQEVRGRLVGLGILLLLVAGLGLGRLYFDVRSKDRHYAQVQQEIKRLFEATLPETRIVQPVNQMRDKIRELENRLEAFGGLSGAQLSGLQILQEISARVPKTLVVEVDNLTVAPDVIDLSGTTASYDDVVKLRDALEASPSLIDVKINNSRQNLANKVEFKLTIKTVQTVDPSS